MVVKRSIEHSVLAGELYKLIIESESIHEYASFIIQNIIIICINK